MMKNEVEQGIENYDHRYNFPQSASFRFEYAMLYGLEAAIIMQSALDICKKDFKDKYITFSDYTVNKLHNQHPYVSKTNIKTFLENKQIGLFTFLFKEEIEKGAN